MMCRTVGEKSAVVVVRGPGAATAEASRGSRSGNMERTLCDVYYGTQGDPWRRSAEGLITCPEVESACPGYSWKAPGGATRYTTCRRGRGRTMEHLAQRQ